MNCVPCGGRCQLPGRGECGGNQSGFEAEGRACTATDRVREEGGGMRSRRADAAAAPGGCFAERPAGGAKGESVATG